jgi:hypothetical protein
MGGKRKSRTDEDSDPEDSHPTAKGKKKVPKHDDDEGSEEEVDKSVRLAFKLTDNRKVQVREFKKKLYVDIREFYTKDGKSLPGKKGISLTKDQWETLLEHADEVTAIFESE